MPEVKLEPGVNINDPEVIARLRKEAAEIEAAHKLPEQLVDPADIVDAPFTLGGLPCRPLSGGVFALLDMLDSPFVKEGASPEFADVIEILFLLLSEAAPEELTGMVLKGKEHFRTKALAWSFDLDLATLGEMQRDFAAIQASFADTMELYSASGEGDKKKSATG